jgi:hypothetical protein
VTRSRMLYTCAAYYVLLDIDSNRIGKLDCYRANFANECEE